LSASETLVKVEGVSKKFCRDLKRSLWYGVKDITSEMLGGGGNHEQLRKDEFWAVKEVSFELKRGECLGLIGHNGAGKSSLLKMLNGLIKPDQGKIVMKGKIGTLIELGAGFNPILTGRENIYVNGQILGFSKKEIDTSFDEIVAFSEIGDFIDTPVQNYSSGMKVRLGFAVAAQMEPDVLLIDEVLAVGDIGFVLKCFNKMDKLLANTAIVLVTHNIPQVARMSTRLLLMKNGTVLYNDQDIANGISMYYSMFEQPVGNYIGSDTAELLDIILKSNGRTSKEENDFYVNYGEELFVSIRVKFNKPIKRPRISLSFYDKEQRNFGEVFNFQEQINDLNIQEFTYEFEACFSRIEFSQGVFSITVGLTDLSDKNRKVIFRKQSAVFFQVKGRHHGWAPMQFEPKWKYIAR